MRGFTYRFRSLDQKYKFTWKFRILPVSTEYTVQTLMALYIAREYTLQIDKAEVENFMFDYLRARCFSAMADFSFTIEFIISSQSKPELSSIVRLRWNEQTRTILTNIYKIFKIEFYSLTQRSLTFYFFDHKDTKILSVRHWGWLYLCTIS